MICIAAVIWIGSSHSVIVLLSCPSAIWRLGSQTAYHMTSLSASYLCDLSISCWWSKKIWHQFQLSKHTELMVAGYQPAHTQEKFLTFSPALRGLAPTKIFQTLSLLSSLLASSFLLASFAPCFLLAPCFLPVEGRDERSWVTLLLLLLLELAVVHSIWLLWWLLFRQHGWLVIWVPLLLLCAMSC